MKPTIFIIDNEPDMRDLLRDFVKVLGYEVSCFSSPIPALQELREKGKRPLVIISDVCMSPMGGIDFLRIARRDFPQVPVLLITASLVPEVRMNAIKMGAVDCLIKPFPLLTLENSIQKALGSTDEAGSK